MQRFAVSARPIRRSATLLAALLIVAGLFLVLVAEHPRAARWRASLLRRTSVAAANANLWSPNLGPETAGGWRKLEGNPVLGEAVGTTFDVSVLKEEHVYRMWLSWRQTASIAVTESVDGIRWGPPTIVLGPDATTGWEDRVNRPVVLKRDGLYQMWYVGQTSERSWIGYATSTNGADWERQASPVLAAAADWEGVAVMSPHVVWDDETHQYRMWYAAGDQLEPDVIGYAVSQDGVHWSRHPEPVFRPAVDGSWDGYKVGGPFVTKQGAWHVLFYIGFRDVDHAQIGLACSRDGVIDWRRHPTNPIIRPGFGRAWDRDAVYKASALREEDRWTVWFNGRRHDIEQVGVATLASSSDLCEAIEAADLPPAPAPLAHGQQPTHAQVVSS